MSQGLNSGKRFKPVPKWGQYECENCRQRKCENHNEDWCEDMLHVRQLPLFHVAARIGHNASSLSLERQDQHAAGDEEDARPLAAGGPLTEKRKSDDGNEHQAEFVHRGDFRCFADL